MAKTAFLSSLHSALPALAAPYPNRRVAGMRVTSGVAAAVAPVGSAVRMSTAYLNMNGTYSIQAAHACFPSSFLRTVELAIAPEWQL